MLEELRRVSIEDLERQGILRLWLDPRDDGTFECWFENTLLHIIPVGQPFGGIRVQFRCPCGRQCTLLYDAPVRGWCCRACTGLRYMSQRMSVCLRVRHKAFALYDRINVDYHQHPRVRGPKPRRMRWREYWSTYWLAQELDTLALLASVGAIPKPRRISKWTNLWPRENRLLDAASAGP